jgi:hypothetical protein
MLPVIGHYIMKSIVHVLQQLSLSRNHFGDIDGKKPSRNPFGSITICNYQYLKPCYNFSGLQFSFSIQE